MNFNLNKYLEFIKNKKKNFVESIDINLIIKNKNKKILKNEIELFYFNNDMKKSLLINFKKKDILNNKLFIGFEYFKYLNFDNIYANKENFLIFEKKKLLKKYNIKLIKNEDYFIKNYFSKKIIVNINNKNYLNIKIGNTNFLNSMIIKNFNFLLQNLKNIFLKNNIFIEKIFISSTMSKSFLLK